MTNPAKIFFFWSSVRCRLFAFIIFLPWGCSGQKWKSWATTLSASSEAFLNSPAFSGSSSSYKGWKDHFFNSHFKGCNNHLFSFALATLSFILSPFRCSCPTECFQYLPVVMVQLIGSVPLRHIWLICGWNRLFQEYMQIFSSSFDQVSQRRTYQTRFQSNKEVPTSLLVTHELFNSHHLLVLDDSVKISLKVSL